MTLQDVEFPITEAYGSTGGPQYRTDITTNSAAATEAVSRWSTGKHLYSLRHDIRSHADIYTVLNWWHAHKGAALGFLIKDFFDYATTADGATLADGIGAAAPAHGDQFIGSGDGVKTDFQLYKTYTAGSFSTVRNITKPKSGTVLVGLDTGSGPVNQASGWSVDYSTGILTFSTAPDPGDGVYWGGEFRVPVRFTKEAQETLQQASVALKVSGIRRLNCEEIVNATEVADPVFRGGYQDLGAISGNASIFAGAGDTVSVDPQSGSLKVLLPALSAFRVDGGPMYKIINNSGSNTITIADSTGTNIATPNSIPTSQGAEVFILRDSSNNRFWKALIL